MSQATIDTARYWGQELILDVGGCDKTKINDREFLTQWVKDLVQEIGMVAYGEPQLTHFGHGEPHLSGMTVLQFIETSNILVHFCDEDGAAYFNVFSCKEFDPQIVVDNIERNFKPSRLKATMLNRQA